MTTPSVIEIIQEYLKAHGFDGLCNDDCGCGARDLSPGNCLTDDCQAAYEVPCDCGDHDCHMVTTRPKEEEKSK